MEKSHQASQWTNRGMGSILMCKEAHCDFKKMQIFDFFEARDWAKGIRESSVRRSRACGVELCPVEVHWG